MSDVAANPTNAVAAESGAGDNHASDLGSDGAGGFQAELDAFMAVPANRAALLDADDPAHAHVMRMRSRIYAKAPSNSRLNGEPVNDDGNAQISGDAEGVKAEVEFAPAMSRAEYEAIDLDVVAASPDQAQDPELVSFAKDVAHQLELDPADLRRAVLVHNLRAADMERGNEIDFDGEKAASMADLELEFGDKLPGKLARAKQAVAKVPQLAEFLAVTGLGNHLGIIRLMVRAGERLAAQGKL